MNTAEKLRFLADRAEDGKEFLIKGKDDVFKIDKVLFYRKSKGGTSWYHTPFDLNDLRFHSFSLKPQWSFTEDEKVILSNTPQEYLWIARDKYGDICIYSKKPIKTRPSEVWDCSVEYKVKYLEAFNHIFQSIQWSDDEPCEFRRYI